MKKSLQKKVDSMSPEQKLDYLIEKVHRLEAAAYPGIVTRIIRWISSHWVLVLFFGGLIYMLLTYSSQITDTYNRIQKISDQVNTVEQTTREGIDGLRDTLDSVGDTRDGLIDSVRELF